jgi:hypothetical protein
MSVCECRGLNGGSLEHSVLRYDVMSRGNGVEQLISYFFIRLDITKILKGGIDEILVIMSVSGAKT